MDIELKPCPFCGGKAEVLQDTVTTWGLIIHEADCWLAYDEPSRRQKVPAYEFGSWNTRAERTCQVLEVEKLDDVYVHGFYLTCGHSMINPFNCRPGFCPWCGAKVVE